MPHDPDTDRAPGAPAPNQASAAELVADLKPCPFCGGEAEVGQSYIPREHACRIICDACGVHVIRTDPWSSTCAKTRAIAAWNTRLTATSAEASGSVEDVRNVFYNESIAAVELQPGTQVVAIDSFMRCIAALTAQEAAAPGGGSTSAGQAVRSAAFAVLREHGDEALFVKVAQATYAALAAHPAPQPAASGGVERTIIDQITHDALPLAGECFSVIGRARVQVRLAQVFTSLLARVPNARREVRLAAADELQGYLDSRRPWSDKKARMSIPQPVIERALAALRPADGEAK